ncbi:MAG: GIY-YIG nuclease family protein [archaeon]
MAEFFVYVLRCADGTLYVGSTDNIERRVVEHQLGKGAKYTRGRAPVRVVYLETFPSRSEAMRREKAVKKLGKAGKEKLVERFGLEGKTGPRRGPEQVG